jgi:glycosyltransferase involved in cell wall biosynthesis
MRPIRRKRRGSSVELQGGQEMNRDYPLKVLITGGHEIGGVGSVAAGLAEGFISLGIPAEIVSPARILQHWRDLRDEKILKILSTTAVFAAPFARRAICIAHGIPCADVQGWTKCAGIIGSFKLANLCGAQVTAVSEYTAVHLQALFNVRMDAVVRNPLKPLFLAPPPETEQDRPYITYVGRLSPAKNIHRLLPAICDLLDERPDLRACIIGDGILKDFLVQSAANHPRVEFKGSPDDLSVRQWLRRTKVFVSGNGVEGLGVTYLEALSQGCVVAMPASGGGLELALDRIGANIQLLPLSLDRKQVLESLRKAAAIACDAMTFEAYEPRAVASAYLEVDRRRFEQPQAAACGRAVCG